MSKGSPVGTIEWTIREGDDETWRHALPAHRRIAYNAPAGFNRPYGTSPGLRQPATQR